MNRLENKIAVITGGSGGIGTATARLFLQEDAQVVLVDLSEDKLKEAVQQLGSDRVSYCVADVTQAAQVQNYVRFATEKHGRIDVFFNNAGIEGAVKPIEEYPEEMFDKVLAVNVKGVWLGLKYVMPVMQQNGGGSIIITSSVAGLAGTPNVSAYVTSKHAVIGTMRTAALEGAPHNIRVNTVHPAPIDNRMMRSLEEGFAPGAGTAAKQGFEAAIPLKRYGTSEEVSQLVLFLATDESRYITGGTYAVDGGMTA